MKNLARITENQKIMTKNKANSEEAIINVIKIKINHCGFTNLLMVFSQGKKYFVCNSQVLAYDIVVGVTLLISGKL